jgi:hypothetical protein
MSDKYEKLREFLAKATPGPWIAVEAHESCPFPSGVAIAIHTEAEPWVATGRICSMTAQGNDGYSPETTTANAQLAVAARNALPALLADLDAANKELAAYKKAKSENDERFMVERDEARAAYDRCVKNLTEEESRRWALETDLDALRTENAKLREALEPFAKMGDTRFAGSVWEDKPDVPIIFHSATEVGVTPSDFYLARTTLGGHQ